jgi:RNA polymerase sigma-70 factor (ECF subfamily)
VRRVALVDTTFFSNVPFQLGSTESPLSYNVLTRRNIFEPNSLYIHEDTLDSHAEFKKAYQEYGQAIYRFLYWQTKDSVLAQDLASATFERAWKARKSFTGGSVQAWLYRIARNLLTDYWRKKKDLLIEDMPGLAEKITDNAAPYDYDAEAMEHSLAKSLDALPPELRAIVVLRFIEGLSAREVGAILGHSEGNIRIMQYRALKKLRKLLDDEQ